MTNLVASCIACNLGKGDRVPMAPEHITRNQFEASIACHAFEYALQNLKIPLPIQGWACWQIWQFCLHLEHWEVFSMMEEYGEWFAFHGAVLDYLGWDDPDDREENLRSRLGEREVANDNGAWDVI